MRHLRALRDSLRLAFPMRVKLGAVCGRRFGAGASDHSKRFLLCLGTQKAGTSWLFDFIRNIDSVEMGFAKELHVFDRLEFPDFLDRDLRALKAVDSRQKLFLNRNLWARLSFVADPDKYFDYFHEIIHRDGVSVSGDFTPEYCMLSERRLKYLREGFSRRGIEVKVVFLMRDPVERIWSAQRMTARLSGKKHSLLGSYQGKYVEKLTRYEVIIPKIRNVFGDDNVYINFYENLFKEETVFEILKFLGVSLESPDFGKRVNASRYESIPQEDREVVADYYSDTYDFVRREFRDIYPFDAWSK